TIPAASDRAVASSSCRLASAASLASVATSSAVPWSFASVCRRAAAISAVSCSRSMSALRAATSVSARSSEEARPSAATRRRRALACHARRQPLAVEPPRVETPLQLEQLPLQREAMLLLFIPLPRETVLQPHHVEARSGEVQLDDRVAGGDGVPRMFEDPQH